MHNSRVASRICILLYLGAFRRDSSHSGLVTGIARIPRTKVVTSLRPRIQLRVFPFFPLYNASLRPFTFTHSRVVRWSVPTQLYVPRYACIGASGFWGFWTLSVEAFASREFNKIPSTLLKNSSGAGTISSNIYRISSISEINT